MTNDQQEDRWPDGFVVDSRYEIIELLDTTKRSQVYKAQELIGLRHTVVIKRLRPDKVQDPETRERLRREATILRQIRHPSVLPVYDIHIGDEECYFVTEFADKGSLKDYLETEPDRKLIPIEALEIAASVCQGLEAAHKQLISHRDIKPGNILLFSADGGRVLAKLGDFSIARVPDHEHITQVDKRICTEAYAPPEQLEAKEADARSDVFSWAVVFFEMLSGENPDYSLKNPNTHFPTLDEFPLSFFVDRGIPPQLAAVLQKALRHDQQLRYQSATEALEVLKSITPPTIDDIRWYLSEGTKFAQAEDWRLARAEFETGMESCAWYGDNDRFPSELEHLFDELQTGCLCARGMICMMERRWQDANAILKQLETLGPAIMGVDITAQLGLTHLEQQHESQLRLIAELKEQKKWSEVLREIGKLEEINQLLATHRGSHA